MHEAPIADVDALLPSGRQVVTTAGCATNLHRLVDGTIALHLVNYGYDREADAVLPVTDVDVAVTLPSPRTGARLVSPDGTDRRLEVRQVDGRHVVTLDRLGVYAIVVFDDGGRSEER